MTIVNYQFTEGDSMEIKNWLDLIGFDESQLDIEGITDAEWAGALLLLLVHKGYNGDVWDRHRRRYWGAFAEKLELSLGAATLAEFASNFANEMSNDIGRNKIQRRVAVEIAYHANAEEIFEKIRASSEMLITLVRVIQEMIKADRDQPDPDAKGGEALYGLPVEIDDKTRIYGRKL